jgi:hypothetical protein
MAYNRRANTGIPVPNPGGNRRPGQPYTRPGGLPTPGPNANMQGFNRPGPQGPAAPMNPGPGSMPGPNAHFNPGPGNIGNPNQMTPGPAVPMNPGPGQVGGPRPYGRPNQMTPMNPGPRRLPQPRPNSPMRPGQVNPGPGNVSPSPGQWAGDIRRVPQNQGGGYNQNQQNPMNTGGFGAGRRGGARRVGSNNALAGRMGRRRY